MPDGIAETSKRSGVGQTWSHGTVVVCRWEAHDTTI